MTTAKLRNLLLTVAFLSLGLGAPAQAQEQIRVRSWQHSDFARIVFDWPGSTDYSAELEDQVLTVRFDRPFQAVLSDVASRLADYVSQATPSEDDASVTFQLTREMTVADFVNENSVVIDLRFAAAEAPQPPEAAPASPEPVQADATKGEVRVPIRVGEHPAYTRIVFDWPNPPEYGVDRDGRMVSIRFSRAAQMDVAALRESLPPGIAAVALAPDGGRTRVVLAVPEGAELRHFPLEEKVVLDVLASVEDRNVPAPPLPPDQLPQIAEAEPESASEPEPETETVEEDSPATEGPPAQESDLADAEREVVPEAPTSPTEEEIRQQQDAALAEGIEEGQITFREGFEPDLDLPPEEAEESPPQTREPIPAPDKPEFAEAPQAAEQPDVPPPPAAEDDGEESVGPSVVTYTFQWSDDVGAVVFRRADNIWIIFDASAPIELSPLRTEGAPVIDRLDQLPIAGATVLRLHIPDQLINASSRREGFDWVVEFRRGPQRPEIQVPIIADVTAEIGAHLVFPSNTPSKAINIPDPEMGDTMRVATLLESSVGMDGLRRYPEFEMLPTAQGLVMISLADTVLLDRNFDGFQVSAPDGLAIAAVSPETPVSPGPALSARRLFDLSGLMRGDQFDFETLDDGIFRSLAEVRPKS